MARFLSTEWFDDVRRHGPPPAPTGTGSGDRLVIEQVVRGTPEGEVRYLVVVDEGDARIVPPAPGGPGVGAGGERPTPDLTITSDWETASALARGELSAQSALAEGRLRVRGGLDRLLPATARLAGRDPLPEAVRRATTFD